MVVIYTVYCIHGFMGKSTLQDSIILAGLAVRRATCSGVWITSCFHRDSQLKTRCSGGLASQETSIADSFHVANCVSLTNLKKAIPNSKNHSKTSGIEFGNWSPDHDPTSIFSWTPLENKKNSPHTPSTKTSRHCWVASIGCCGLVSRDATAETNRLMIHPLR